MRTRASIAFTTVLLLTACAAVHALARPEQRAPRPGGDVLPVREPQPALFDQRQFNEKAWAWLSFTSHQYGPDNPAGLVRRWLEEPEAYCAEQFSRLSGLGYQVIVLFLPAGRIHAGVMPSAQALTMHSERHRAALSNASRQWLRGDNRRRLGIYMGFVGSDPTSLSAGVARHEYRPSPDKPGDFEVLMTTLEWFRNHCGVSMAYLDNSSPPEHAAVVAKWHERLAPHGIQIGFEAFVLNHRGTGAEARELHPDFLQYPQMATPAFIRVQQKQLGREWTIPPAADLRICVTAIHSSPKFGAAPTDEELRHWLDQGFGLVATGQHHEQVARVVHEWVLSQSAR